MKLRYENIRKKSVDKSMDKLLTNSGTKWTNLALIKKGISKTEWKCGKIHGKSKLSTYISTMWINKMLKCGQTFPKVDKG